MTITPEEQALSDGERESLIAGLRPPRRALTKREESAFLAASLTVFEQRDAHEAEDKKLSYYDEQRIFFRAGLAALAAREDTERPDDVAQRTEQYLGTKLQESQDRECRLADRVQKLHQALQWIVNEEPTALSSRQARWASCGAKAVSIARAAVRDTEQEHEP